MSQFYRGNWLGDYIYTYIWKLWSILRTVGLLNPSGCLVIVIGSWPQSFHFGMFDSSPTQQVLAATSKGLSLKDGNGKSLFRDDFTIDPFIWNFSAIHVWLRKGSEKHCILLVCMFTSSPSICPRPLVLIRSLFSLTRLQVCCFCPYNCLLYPHCCVLYPDVSFLYLYMYICIYSYRHVLITTSHILYRYILWLHSFLWLILYYHSMKQSPALPRYVCIRVTAESRHHQVLRSWMEPSEVSKQGTWFLNDMPNI